MVDLAYLSPEFLFLRLNIECIQDLDHGFIAAETLNEFLFSSDVWASACVVLDIMSGGLYNPSQETPLDKILEVEENMQIQYSKILRFI